MKCRSRVLALVLAVVLACGLTVPAFAAESQTISATLSPDVTVKYNGEAQAMADATGSPVYPILYQGTTYVPIRAISNMLCISVDWDSASRTVLLSDEGGSTAVSKTETKPAAQTIKATLSPDVTVKYNGEVQTMKDATGTVVYPVLYNGTTYLPIRAVSNMLGIAVDWDQATRTVLLGETDTSDKTENAVATDVTLLTSAGQITVNTGDEAGAYEILSAAGISDAAIAALLAQVNFITTDTLGGLTTSSDATILSNAMIGYDYATIDWSTASEGYIKVKVNIQLTELTSVSIKWYNNDTKDGAGHTWYVNTTDWVKLPLVGGNAEYGITVYPMYTENDNDTSLYRNELKARFTAKVKDPDAVWLMSNVYIDFENAPNTCAKALELTQNCKTDAEKITAIFNWVSQNIQYDHTLHAKELAGVAEGKPIVRDLNPDSILASKSGVCEHYAVLMAAMLRSLGIECKVATGDFKVPNTDDSGHAWVAVSPDVTGLNLTALGAGHEPDGWIRLDPTNASYKNYTSDDTRYTVNAYY